MWKATRKDLWARSGCSAGGAIGQGAGVREEEQEAKLWDLEKEGTFQLPGL